MSERREQKNGRWTVMDVIALVGGLATLITVGTIGYDARLGISPAGLDGAHLDDEPATEFDRAMATINEAAEVLDAPRV